MSLRFSYTLLSPVYDLVAGPLFKVARLLQPLAARLVTRLNVVFEDVLRACPRCAS